LRTLAEESLVHELTRVVLAKPCARLLNIGAGSSVVIEQGLPQGCTYVVDRVDIEPATVDHPRVRNVWQCSVADMRPVPASEYSAVFANYVLEHVQDLESAAREMSRVLEPGGIAIFTLPNPMAPEFVLSRWTSMSFHRRVRRAETWQTVYAYRSIPDLVSLFCEAGFEQTRIDYYPVVGAYMDNRRILAPIGRAYDRMVAWLGWPGLLGQCCLVLVRV
jgi:SAM-dependent methyltransferase